MAIEVERQGIAFYAACMESIDSSALKETFSFLIDQEQDHLDIFFRMKERLNDFRLPESFSGEYESHITSFVRDRVFAAPASAVDKVRRLQDVQHTVAWAVGFEEKSIAFYRLIKDRLRASEKETIEQIIGEEQRHIERLNALKYEQS
jgi:rubrerythrin